MSYIYLASPYSHPNAMVMAQRYQAARDAVAYLLKRRVWTYSPIVHCHDLACHHNLPRGFAFWQPYNHTMLGAARALFILDIPGVAKSHGVADELKTARKLNLSLTYMRPCGPTDYAFNPALNAQFEAVS